MSEEMVPVEAQKEDQSALTTIEGFANEYGIRKAVTTIINTTEQGRLAFLRAINDVQANSDAWVNKEFDVADVTIFEGSYVEVATGEVKRTVRVTLTLADGEMISFNSQGVLQSLSALLRFKIPSSTNPVKWTLKKVPTKTWTRNHLQLAASYVDEIEKGAKQGARKK